MIDLDWADEQLSSAGVSEETTGAVLELLKQLKMLNAGTEAAELFYKLAQGIGIAPTNVLGGGKWKQFHLGDVPQGSTVRVKSDAYTGSAGTAHNGRAGRLVAARGGYGVVQYADSADGTGHRHHPRLLEVLEAD